jgi:hypothetical protein
MVAYFSRWGAALGIFVVVAGSAAACGSKGSSSSTTHGTGGAGTGGAGTGTNTGGTGTGGLAQGGGGSSFITSSGAGTGGNVLGFDVEPSTLVTLTVPLGQTMPTQTYMATYNGNAIPVSWSVDQGNLGTVPGAAAPTAVFAPTGTAGGTVNVLATLNGQTLKRPVLIKITGSQNGGNPSIPSEGQQIPCVAGGTPACNAGVLQAGGGIGGVGGEGLGPAAMNFPTGTPMPASAQSLTFLYPYDKTVWPRGMLAPLLMWSWTPGNADAIQITLSDQAGNFTWTGTFGPPAILTATPPPATGSNFIHHPIPQDVWDAATNTASGPSDPLTVSLVVAKGGVAYGPITETWIVAPARLTGTVYYNSYGTQLVKNWVSLDKAGHSVGAAVLGVRSGDVAPTLIVGENSPTNAAGNPSNDTGCRVCHVVSSKGRWLLTQSEQGTPGDGLSFLYDLSQPVSTLQTTAVTLATQGTFGWAGLTGDGSYALTNTVNPSSSNPAIGVTNSGFWNFIPTQPPSMMSPTVMPAQGTLTGLPAPLSAGYPSYSPDDSLIAYTNATGNTGDVAGKPIVVAAYDSTTQTFSNPQTVVTPTAAQLRIGYPVFLPDNSGILFESQVRKGCSDSVMVTRNGTRSQLWWTNIGAAAAPQPVALATLNGTGYVPTAGNNHGVGNSTDPENCGMNESTYDDTTLNYEPTVLPVVAGGYAWVVITSRRLYGNELTATPWQSWPPDYNTQDLSQAAVKKLWVAAIDLGAAPGADPSHPAFYLPAQEILAGNSRGFWVLDPCASDGTACQTGDQCCNGYCEPNGDAGALICSNAPVGTTCSAPQEKCTTAKDCCDMTNTCVNGFCAIATPG